MLQQAIAVAKRGFDSAEALAKAKKDLEGCFERFKHCPTPHFATLLGKSMTAYGCAFAEAEKDGHVKAHF